MPMSGCSPRTDQGAVAGPVAGPGAALGEIAATPLGLCTRHDPAQVRRRLGFLAHHLTGQGTRDFAWWQLAATTHAFTRATTFTLALLSTLAFGLRPEMGSLKSYQGSRDE